MLRNKYFKIFADCIIVDGLNGALIYDLNRHKLYPISTEISSALKQSNGQNIKEIKNTFSIDFSYVLDEVIKKELGFITSDPGLFPEISFEYDDSPILYSTIIEIVNHSNFNIVNLLKQINDLGCKQVLFFINWEEGSVFKKEVLDVILSTIFDSFITVAEFIISEEYEHFFDDEMLSKNLRISKILFYNSKENYVKVTQNDVVKVYNKTISVDWNENIEHKYFYPNIKIFSESKTHNLGLNKKVCINGNGDIKNYFNHSKIHGNINSISIKEIISTESFQKKWKISNDNINYCRNCKFRYCCVSNSDLYLNDGMWQKMHYCSYVNEILNK